MKLEVKREVSNDVCTVGALYVNDVFKFFTLEDPVRDVKIMHETAIPAGEYRVDISFSNRFKRDLPILLNVPGFTGIRIHPGNTAADTSGCILVGMTKGYNVINYSRVAFDTLYEMILTAHMNGEALWIKVGPP